MRTAIRLGAVTVAAVIFSGCGGGGGDDGGGTTPPPPAVATPASISVTASSSDAMVSLGDTRTLTAVVRDAAGNALPGASVAWTTDNAAAVTVPGSGATVTATAAGNGTATITAASGTVRATVPLSVAQRLATVGLTPNGGSFAPGATQQLAAAGRDARGNPIAGVTGFTFTSSSGATAAVSATGLMTAIAPGTATITAAVTRDGISATGTAPITITAPVAGSSAETVVATTTSAFQPPRVDIARGGSVTWQFESLTHNVTFNSANAPASIPASTNVRVSRTFNASGSFPYDCTLHPGMTGTVNVLAGSFLAALNGANERPNPVTTNGSGFSTFTLNGTTVSYVVTFTGLTSTLVGAHIHGPGNANQAVGVLVNFPTASATGTTGVLTGTFTAADIRAAAGQPAMSLDSLLTLMRNGNAYVNVHTTVNPGGEIRGQLGAP